MVILTREMLESLKSSHGGFTKAATRPLGVKWPLVKGWLKKLEGKEVSEKKWREAEKGKENLTKYGKRTRRKRHKKDLSESAIPDWTGQCEICGESPIVPQTGMCGPCTFGEADTLGGNW